MNLFSLIIWKLVLMSTFSKNKLETLNFTISDESMSVYELNKKLKTERENAFIFIQKQKLTMNFCSNLSNIKMQYHIEPRIRLCIHIFSE